MNIVLRFISGLIVGLAVMLVVFGLNLTTISLFVLLIPFVIVEAYLIDKREKRKKQTQASNLSPRSA